MKHCRFVLGIALGTLAVSTIGFGAIVTAARPETTIQRMPPNEAKLMASMLKKYNLKVDDANPAAQPKWDGRIVKGGATAVTTAAAQDVVQQYLQAKFGAKPKDQPNPLQRQQLFGSGTADQVQLRSAAPADSGSEAGSSNCPAKSELKTDNILVLLVEFSDVTHNQLPQPAKENKLDYWVSDFSTSHYQSILFGRDSKALNMRNYFLEQSGGLFTVDGKVADWVKVSLPESNYGADSAAGGTDNANGPVWRIVKDALQAAGSKVNWAQYDKEDPRDLDNDGNLQEADGYIDHLMLVHAGAGQEGGGGEQGDDAIWSHSGWANGGGTDGPGLGGVATSDPKVFAGPYTIMPEDGSIGVFCHEFTHDLGLPDEYDTIYSGEASTAYWSLMSSGSWAGLPLGTQPSGISIWGRIQLGWVKPQVVPYQSEDKLLWLNRNGKLLNNQAIRINLPDKTVAITTNQPYSGKYEWYSGAGDDLNETLTRTLDLTGVSQATLKFQTWYNIEEDYDFGFVEVSQDNGKTWVNLPGNLTRTWEGANVITGESQGWVAASYDLGKYAGSKITLRFRYYTDGGYTLPGWAIDDIRIEALGFTDDVEAGAGSWAARGWRIYEGQETVAKEQYYLLEQRNHQGFDRGLAQLPNVYATDQANYYAYQPGVLLWLVDNEYTDNWVGKHPGHGYLLVVDSHPEPDLFGTKAFRTRLQIRDAAFGLLPTKPVTLTVLVDKEYQKAELKSRKPTSRFSDSRSYWVKELPDNSSIVPQYGVNFQVLSTSPDQANSLIYIYFRK